MADQLSSERARYVIADEVTYGVDQVDLYLQDGAEDILYQELASPVVDPDRTLIEFDRARGSASGNRHATVPLNTAVSATYAMTGASNVSSGTSSVPEAPGYREILLAANLVETVVAATSATYTPATVAQGSYTAYYYGRQLNSENYRLVYTTGVRNNLNFVFNMNEEAVIEMNGIGLYQGVWSDRAQFFDPSTGAVALLKDGVSAVTARTTGVEQYLDRDPILVKGITLQIDGVEFEVTAINMDLGWTLAPIETANASTGITEVKLTRPSTGSRIGGSLTLFDGENGFDKAWDLYEDDSEVSFSLVATSGDGGSGSDRITLTASNLQLFKPAEGDSNGLRTFDIPWFLNGDWSDLAADNDFTLVYDTVP